MATGTYDREQARRRARRMRAVNVVMRRLLALPFPTPLSRQLMLLRATGRRTGRHYRQPLSYVRDGDALLTPGGGRWTLNLQDGPAVRLRLAGRTLQARPELVSDVTEVDTLLMTMAASNPRLTRFVPIPRRADGHFDEDALRTAIAHGFCIVRWHLVTGAPARS